MKELTADLIGDYVFNDYDFIHNLSTNIRNLFRKIYDEIRYLCKVATAGSKEARALEKVKHNFEKAWRAQGKIQTEAKGLGEVKDSITEAFTDNNGNHYENAVLLDTNFFDGISPRNWGDKLQDEVNRRASDNPFILPIVDENGNTTLLQFAGPNERVKKDGGAAHKVLDELSMTADNISKLAVIHIDEIVSVSEENSPYFTEENNHGWLDKNGWLHRNANVINKKNGNIYNLTVDIAKTADGRTILYSTKGNIKKVGNAEVNSLKIKGSGLNSNSSDIISENSKKSSGNARNSLSQTDKDIAPVRDGYSVYGDDNRVKGHSELDFNPFADDIGPVRETVQKDIAPVVEPTEATGSEVEEVEDVLPLDEGIASVAEEDEAIRPRKQATEPTTMEEDIGPVYDEGLVSKDSPDGKERKWVGTSTESEPVQDKVLPDDLNQDRAS